MMNTITRLWCALRGHPNRFCADTDLSVFTLHCPECGKTWKEDRP